MHGGPGPGSIVAVLEDRALVLNRSWAPITTTSVRRALVLVVRGAAGVVHPETFRVHSWDEWVGAPAEAPEVPRPPPRLHGFSLSVRVPEVIALRESTATPSARSPSRDATCTDATRSPASTAANGPASSTSRSTT